MQLLINILGNGHLAGEVNVTAIEVSAMRNVHPPQQIHALLATDLISQIVLQVTFWQYRVKLFLNILGQFIVLQFGPKMNKIRPVMSEILDCKGVLRG